MKKLLSLSYLLILFYSVQSNASIVNVISSDGAFAGNSATDLTTLSLLTDTEIANNLSDDNAGTYLFGSDMGGTVSTASLTMSFQDSLSNQTGNDLAFYFMGGSEEINSMHICFTTNCNPTDTSAYNATTIDVLGVTLGELDSNNDPVYYALSVIAFDLSDFGFSSGQLLDEFSIDLIAGGYNRLAGIENLHPAPVPIPAALILFLSGLTALGLFGRKSK